MVGAVLVQNTRWANVHRAIAALRAQGWLSPEALARVGITRLAEVIRSAGCQRVKARRLHQLAVGIESNGGVTRLARLSTAALRERLLAWHGVGEETADAMLLFAFNRPVFIADGYARRWLSRMGLFESGAGSRAYERCAQFAHGRLGTAVDYQALHAAIVLHGQAHCARHPRCENCCVAKNCSLKNN